MKLTINWKLLGGAVLGGGATLKEFGGSRETWWLAMVMLVLGPMIMAIRNAPATRKRRKKPKPRKKP